MARASKATKISEENGVITWKDTATVSEAFGQVFNPAKEIEFTYTTYANKTAAIANGAWPSDPDLALLNKANADSKLNARGSAVNAELAEFKKKYEESDEYKIKQLAASFVAMDMDADEAYNLAVAHNNKRKEREAAKQ